MKRKVDVPRLLNALGIVATQRGREWVAHCPNPTHNDRHPSWRMKDAPLGSKHGYHKCHPCGFGGGPQDLVARVRGITMDEARDWLKAFHHGEQEEPPVDRVRWVNRSLTRVAFVLPSEVTVEPLEDWPGIAREYAESRGITAEQVDCYGMGYAVHGKLEGRIVLVARDIDGIARTYTARSFVGHGKRYIAADRSERPDYACMFGEQFWPPARERKFVVALEGAINGLTVDRALPELPFAVTGGTEAHPAHFGKLASFEHVLLLTDPDTAGDIAAARYEAMLGRHVRTTRVRLPEGMDAQDAGEQTVREVLCRAMANSMS